MVNYKNAEARTAHLNKFKNFCQNSSNNSNTIFIISNISVKNILFTKAELFAIRYDISQAFQIQDVICIVIITNTIPVAKRIFDLIHHPYQLYSIIISKDLRKFFNRNPNNTITF